MRRLAGEGSTGGPPRTATGTRLHVDAPTRHRPADAQGGGPGRSARPGRESPDDGLGSSARSRPPIRATRTFTPSTSARMCLATASPWGYDVSSFTVHRAGRLGRTLTADGLRPCLDLGVQLPDGTAVAPRAGGAVHDPAGPGARARSASSAFRPLQPAPTDPTSQPQPPAPPPAPPTSPRRRASSCVPRSDFLPNRALLRPEPCVLAARAVRSCGTAPAFLWHSAPPGASRTCTTHENATPPCPPGGRRVARTHGWARHNARFGENPHLDAQRNTGDLGGIRTLTRSAGGE